MKAPEGYAAFGPAYKPDPRNARVRHSRHADGRGIYIQFPFSPYGLQSLTPFVLKGDWPSSPADPIEPLANDGRLSPHLPEGTPTGLVGTSSLYKRESYPYGRVAEDNVTASFAEEVDRTGRRGHDTSHNWSVQGADAGLYENVDIHAIRLLLLEPTSETRPPGGRSYYNHARERMRILGEVPVRKFPLFNREPSGGC